MKQVQPPFIFPRVRYGIPRLLAAMLAKGSWMPAASYSVACACYGQISNTKSADSMQTTNGLIIAAVVSWCQQTNFCASGWEQLTAYGLPSVWARPRKQPEPLSTTVAW
ncbi:hypothetical protein JDV02_009038 [Purpureocillium takamizusanense]|uniref:Uncharacterized protein n=1 Tax=Purpureocillium takamizusanense TaxID=2060973 RepID=A0A9Q8QQV2_9HYPO|nr:uncharacterized protein JDV02_009038 [Purpureocillium takamizusanense]UNI23206.1 hypothetical protein JDV02_009038 [Purpureocillium takamizusanense]